MRTIEYRPLDQEGFSRYGRYAAMLEVDAGRRPPPKLGAPPVEFFRDLLQSGLGLDTTVSFGLCRVSRRPPVIDVSEYHDAACEALLPLDGDVLVHVAPAGPGGKFPAAEAEVFLVPRGTMVVLRPGVWHHGPFIVGRQERVSCLVALPERLYARDCKVDELAEEEWLRVVGPGID